MTQARENPNDQIRMSMLEYFYQRNRRARSIRGKAGSAVKMSDLKRDLKADHGLTQQQVVANLTYLIDQGWVTEEVEEKTVRTQRGTVPSTTTWYRITAQGVDKIEGASSFQPPERYAGINITATGSNVITLGDGNLVDARWESVHSSLSELKAAISQADIDESLKLSAAIDIETLKDQLAKPEPDRSVVRALWKPIEKVATLAQLAGSAAEIAAALGPLLLGAG